MQIGEWMDTGFRTLTATTRSLALPLPIAIMLLAIAGFGSQIPSGASFRTGVELVEINVVARDKEGKPVADLRRDEFQILDNGIAQPIRVFVPEIEKSATPSPEPRAPNTFTNRIAPPAGSRSGYSVILIDDLYSGADPTNEEGTTLSRSRALQMLQSGSSPSGAPAIPEGEKIAIYAPGRRLKVISEFTSDRDQLIRELRKWKPYPTTPAPEARPVFQPQMHPADPQGGPRGNGPAEMDRIDAVQRAAAGDAGMQQIADHLAGIPGRKNLIWLANQFPIGPTALRQLARASVSIYPVDVDGVCRLCPPRPTAEMDAIAAITGGVAYYRRNDIQVAMREAMDDGRVSYALGFYPSIDDDGPPKPHRLLVKTTRPGITLRYRTVYEKEPPTPASDNPVADLVGALNRPIDATAISIDAAVTKQSGRLRVEAKLGVESLYLVSDQGLRTGRIEVVARFITADGVIAAEPVARALVLNLSPPVWDTAVREGLSYSTELPIPPRAVELKLMFANVASDRIGTLTVPLARVKAGSAK
ncbi:MAG TPA: VWA domain-containing protein [Bryobacteraceae bacterium]|nr:VWA domain-containing protein [Bryobacteraceae bacterium]